jgi:hypothetical protein
VEFLLLQSSTEFAIIQDLEALAKDLHSYSHDLQLPSDKTVKLTPDHPQNSLLTNGCSSRFFTFRTRVIFTVFCLFICRVFLFGTIFVFAGFRALSLEGSLFVDSLFSSSSHVFALHEK